MHEKPKIKILFLENFTWSTPVFSQSGWNRPLGAIVMGKGAKKTKGKTGGENANH